MLGRWVSDLEVGDVLGPIDNVLSPFLIHEYAHSVEDTSEFHHSPDQMVAPPTIVHTAKKTLFDAACPEGSGPQARLHLIFEAQFHKAIPAGTSVTYTAQVVERKEHKGREHLVLEIDVRDTVTGDLYTTCHDTSLLGFRPNT